MSPDRPLRLYVWVTLSHEHRQVVYQAAGGSCAIAFRPDHWNVEVEQRRFAAADIAFGNVPASWIVPSGRLRWLQLASTGLDEYSDVRWDLIPPPLLVTNLSGLYTTAVSETVIAGLLGLLRGLPTLVRLQDQRIWRRSDVRASIRVLRGSRVTVLGTGPIGTRVRELLEALGCRVISYARTQSHAELHTPDELERVLPDADALIICLPETHETRMLLSAHRLNLLRPTAFVVNVGRGGILDEHALMDMLFRRRVAGAMLDVTLEEPIPPQSSLWSAPELLLTQHTAGGWNDEIGAKAGFFAENLRRYIVGEELVNVVDFARGY